MSRRKTIRVWTRDYDDSAISVMGCEGCGHVSMLMMVGEVIVGQKLYRYPGYEEVQEMLVRVDANLSLNAGYSLARQSEEECDTTETAQYN